MNCTLIIISVICANLLAICFACRGGRLIRNALVGSIDKHEILKAHNEYRDEVAQGRIPRQPGAQNMLEMRWDDELAQVAQNWADRCVYSHNQDRTINRFDFGENLAIELNSDMTELHDNGNEFQPRVRLWFEEYKFYTFGQEFSKTTGHYTQIIWAETYLIGCGFAYYNRPDGIYIRFYVCNYGPGGNIQGKQPYITGDPACSKYGLKQSQIYRGLCEAASVESNDVTDNSLSNDIEITVAQDSIAPSFSQSSTEFYTSKVTLQPTLIGHTFATFNKTPLNSYNQNPNYRKLDGPSISESTFREILISQTTEAPKPSVKTNITLNLLPAPLSPSTMYTSIAIQQLPKTTISIPFSTTGQSTTQKTAPNAELTNGYASSTVTTFNPHQFSSPPSRPQIRSIISPREYEALIYNYHRSMLNHVFRRQQERTADVQTYLINSGPKPPYFTYKWPKLI